VHFQFEDEYGTNTLECVTLTITAVCSWLWFHCRWLHISIFVTFLFVSVVDEGAIIDVQFSHFYHEPPDGFTEIMLEKSLL